MNIAKIRFKGFEDKWLNETLNTFAKRITRKNANLETSLPVTISSADGIISQTSFFNNVVASNNLRGYYLIKNGEFAYNKSYSNGYPFGSVKRLERYDLGALSTLYILFKLSNDISHDYVVRFFETDLWHRDVAIRAAEGARNHGLLNISAEDFLDIDIHFPVSFSEQRAIASFFQNLDSLIQGTEKKIASLRQMKEASLQAMFPAEGETVPKVRFKGFDGEWKTIKLKDISSKSTQKNTDYAICITLTNSAENGIVNQTDYFDHDISNANNIGGYFVVHNDDFVYNPRISTSAPVGPINRNCLGITGVMSPLYLVFQIKDVNLDYMSYYFKTTLWHNYMKLEGNTGARFDRLSISDTLFFEMPITLPVSAQEQQKIASYFTVLDQQISTQTKRLEKLRQIKSACLDAMFV